MIYRIFLLAFLASFVSACATIKAPKPEEKVAVFSPPQTMGTIQIPITVDLGFVFSKLDKEVPNSFSGEKNQCEGVSFEYLLNRNSIRFYGQQNSVLSEIQGAYKIKANYCVHCSSAFGRDPFCIVPRIYVSCGDKEAMRRIQIDFATQLQLEKNFKLKSITTLKGIKSIDPCEFTFLKYDASKLIEKEISKALKESLGKIDEEIQKTDFRPKIEDLWELAQKPILIPSIGWLHLNPKQVSMGELNFTNQQLRTKVQLDLRPEVRSVNLNTQPLPLPPLGKTSLDSGFRIPLNFDLSYDSLNQILSDRWEPVVIQKGRKKLQIDRLTLLGPDENYLSIQVDFSGSKKGTLFLKGRPTYDAENGLLSLQEVDYDLETKSILLKSGSWLFESRLQKILEEKLVFDLGRQLETYRLKIEKELNREIPINAQQKAVLQGKLKVFDLSYIHPNVHSLQLGLNLMGTANIVIR